MAWRNQCLFPLLDTLNDEDGAMLEPLGAAIHAVRLADIEPGMTAGMFGCGPIGLLIDQVARVSGAARGMATEKSSHRIDAGNLFGVEVFPVDGDEIRAILLATHRRGVDVAFEATGEAFAVVQRREGIKVIVKC